MQGLLRKMTILDFLFSLYGLCFVLLSCEGVILLPPGGADLTFLPGHDAKIQWSVTGALTSLSTRSWHLKHSGGETPTLLARIFGAGSTPDFLISGFAVEGKATLVIKNFNESRNGEYRFTFSGLDPSDVKVSVKKKPNVILDCFSRVLLTMGEDFTCLCRGENGNPAPDVIWIKDGKEIGDRRKYNKTLAIKTNDWQNRGTYTCKAESYPDLAFRDEKSIEVIINYKPANIKIELLPNPAVIDGSVTIKCSSEGFPEPNYIITHNDCKLVTTKKEITLQNVQWKDIGTYKCLANNSLGSDSKSEFLEVKDKMEQGPTTPANSSGSTGSTEADIRDKTCSNDSSCSGITEWHIVGTMMAGIAIGIILSYIAIFSRRKLRNREPQPNPELSTCHVDLTYQELDLKKMNKEDNYESLRVNAARNGDDSTYTELSKTRDVESNYQSLK
ncbi:matrix-remodeling-associated protein 5-like [Dendronephthya gigantea]|uniref:matrix-remodeling-associated protein 5-like n=1 Tax=Dendronephthya gigantea TaxID=151771 RepID=UPI00106C09F7|nr:matrix-remodeling-associated protein 5-like [Dendronephthya gigantea]